MFEKVLIAEDHQSIKISVTQTLTNLGIEARDNYAYDCDNALQRLKKALQDNAPFELLITDLSFDDRAISIISSGKELIDAARALQPSLKIIVFSAESSASVIGKLFEEQGVNGYVKKGRSDTEELQKAVETIHKGKTFISPGLQQAVKAKNAHDFTPLDIAIITQLAKGMLQKNLPAYLQEQNLKPSGLSSVEKRLNHIRETLHISSNEQLVAFCKDKKII
ncbi:response regulator transcription factor [Mucilaginibacter corticis]|uniref:Response regulator transcription factor n=1 Tax=Mucilaginibacter corticis TaxID=2597670 RepID=A0A556M9G3_9SPHI|nr:response regulator [Mucilaginibacter corticis]TSJ36549.1 response regulator transcription factor [Mucilaginibacter corticis]